MSTFDGFIEELPFLSIDRFEQPNLKSSAFLLSHCHADHVVGLDSDALCEMLQERGDVFIYCSEISKLWLCADSKYQHLEKYIVSLPINQPEEIEICNEDGEKNNVKLTLISADHCPGSVMFLLENESTRVLYTGDFRWKIGHAALVEQFKEGSRVKKFQSLYIDTTFCDEKVYCLPDREQCAQALISAIEPHITSCKSNMVRLDCPSELGYENLFGELSKHFEMKIHVSERQWEKYRHIPDLSWCVTPNPEQTQIHACKPTVKKGMGTDTGPYLRCGYRGAGDVDLSVMVVQTSVLWWSMFGVPMKEICIRPEPASKPWFYRACYSTHSSYTEIRDVVEYLRPSAVHANVIPYNTTLDEITAKLQSFVSNHDKESSPKYKPLGIVRDDKMKEGRKHRAKRKTSPRSSAVAAAKKFLEFLKAEELFTTCNYSVLELEVAYKHCKDIYYNECAHISFFSVLDNLLLRGLLVNAQKIKYGIPLFAFANAKRTHAPSAAVVKYLVHEPGSKKLLCRICGCTFVSAHDWHWHMEGKRHKVQCILHEISENKKELVADKKEIQVHLRENHTDAIVRPDEEGRLLLTALSGAVNKYTLIIENVKHEPSVQVCACEMLQNQQVSAFSLTDDLGLVNQSKDICIRPGYSYKVNIEFCGKQSGCYNVTIFVQFKTASDAPNSHDYSFIVRFLQVHCSDEVDTEADNLLKAIAPYKPMPRKKSAAISAKIIKGEPPLRAAENQLQGVLPLSDHRAPRVHQRVAQHGYKKFTNMSMEDMKFIDSLMACLNTSKLSMLQVDESSEHGQYHDYFNYLLHAEEIQMEVDIRQYDMYRVSMEYDRTRPKLLTLKVPGLVESRPSVLKGDHLFVKLVDEPGTEYQGYVCEVNLDQLVLSFPNKLLSRYLRGCKFDVRFTFNRLPLKYQHRAVQLVDELTLEHFVLPPPAPPAGEHMVLDAALPDIRLYDRKLNQEQQRAVEHIVAGTSLPHPYLIFGPPGTGKTVTVVEAIKQLALNPGSNKSCHILACAPSNSAADLLCERLLTHIPAKAILRLNASSRVWSSVPDAIKVVCNYDRQLGDYYYPARPRLATFTIIVTTTVSAGRLASASFPRAHFTHVFVDEGGCAVEPECLIPVAGVMEGGHLVLAGDPRQLGPVLRAPLAIKYNLGQSYLERLMSDADGTSLYSKRVVGAADGERRYDPRYLVKLVRNYRSHPSILEYPNQEFYDGDLKACADQMVSTSLCTWHDLPTHNFPIIFHAVVGKDEREDKSPSFFNADECKVVLKYVQKVLEVKRGQKTKVQQSDIGIISPYRKQVEKISRLLERHGLTRAGGGGIKVGSVEEFQGQERLVIILSAVRSAEEYLQLDAKYRLGFLANPKRLNVAVSRAKALLILVGNPYVLRRDPHWRRLLEHIKAGGGWTGVPCELSAQPDVDQLCDQLETLKLTGDPLQATSDEMTISMKTLIEDPEWISSRQI